ncbi:MAG: 1-phosphofructokinase family hexose kinase [Oscillospiraceae bacterium]|jgi:1-phosphofructokinase|nr:1-phosphofructokinase family hexose kinase [Oscillospiraceae bacterium]
MVVTVTLNPAIDVTARADSLCLGETNRLSQSTVNAGGKGINAARMVRVLGGETLAIGFYGGASGELLLRLLQDDGLPHEFIRVPGETRVNMKVIDASGDMTELNGPGGAVGGEGYRAMGELLKRLAAPEAIFVLSGSLPPDAEPGWYGEAIRMLKGAGAKTLLDTSGEALRLGAMATPYVVKPNRDEMPMIDRSVRYGLLANSLGADGARFYANGREWHIPALPVEVVSPAGAGDCMTGALAYALDKGLPVEEAALLSMAAAAAAVMTPGTLCPAPELIHQCKERYHGIVSPA